MIVLDTNVISEAFKPQANARVGVWLARLDPKDVFTTAVSQAELYTGLAILPDGERKRALAEVIDMFFASILQTRPLAFGEQEALEFARIHAHRRRLGRPIADFDGQIAATARVREFAVATRNTSDFEHCGIKLVNPWEFE